DSLLWNQLADASPHAMHNIGAMLDISALMPAFIIHLALFFVLFGYCMKSLVADRKDRSILFWKSLPLSEVSTVLSKAVSAIVLAPVSGTIACILGAIGMYLVSALVPFFHGVGFGEAFFVLPYPGKI